MIQLRSRWIEIRFRVNLKIRYKEWELGNQKHSAKKYAFFSDCIGRNPLSLLKAPDFQFLLVFMLAGHT
jgi:hypothetical protein